MNNFKRILENEQKLNENIIQSLVFTVKIENDYNEIAADQSLVKVYAKRDKAAAIDKAKNIILDVGKKKSVRPYSFTAKYVKLLKNIAYFQVTVTSETNMYDLWMELNGKEF